MSDRKYVARRAVGSGIFVACLAALFVASGPVPARAQASAGGPDPIQRDKSATAVNIFTGIGNASQQNYAPLTGKQRWKYYLNQNFISVGAFLGPILNSGLDQVGGQPPEWGGGVQGSAQTVGCAVFGQEPRYIRSADERITHRIAHAFVFSLITYNNEGKVRPALPTLASYYVSTPACCSSPRSIPSFRTPKIWIQKRQVRLT